MKMKERINKMDTVKIDCVQFAGYDAYYVDGKLIISGGSVSFREIANLIRDKTVVEANYWVIDDWFDVKTNLDDYDKTKLTLSN